MMRRVIFALALLFPLAAHAALPCNAYPNTLTNGTLADANQVMANFNNILNCVNSLAPLGIPVVGSSSNIKASNATAGLTITVTADSVTVGTALNGTPYTLTSYSQSFNGATNGAGGMDIGALPTSSWVALYAIYNPTAPAISILGTSCAVACPTVYAGGNMPAGYTASALLTVLPTNATPALIGNSYVKGKNVYILAQTAITTTTSHASPTLIALGTVVPPNAVAMSGYLSNVCGTSPSSNSVSIQLGSDSSASSGVSISSGNCASINNLTIQSGFQDVGLPTAQTMWIENNVSGVSPSSSVVVSAYLLP